MKSRRASEPQKVKETDRRVEKDECVCEVDKAHTNMAVGSMYQNERQNNSYRELKEGGGRWSGLKILGRAISLQWQCECRKMQL